MSVSKWAYRPEVCDGEGCPGDCDLCDKPKNMEDDMRDYPYEAIVFLGDKDEIVEYTGVEVVRCKDCKHIKEAHFNILPDGFSCELSGLMVEPEHYCSYGERTEE